TTGSMIIAREYHIAVTLANGSILITGGMGSTGILNIAQLYNPSTGAWTTTGNMSIARYIHTASTLADGKVLVAGGYSGGSGSLNSAELYQSI
ncbi:unnamed protein product, partial [Adineta steineri]